MMQGLNDGFTRALAGAQVICFFFRPPEGVDNIGWMVGDRRIEVGGK